MILTPAQKTTLKAAILADAGVSQMFIDGNTPGVADYLNVNASPSFWVWRTDVSRADIYNKQNDLTVSGAQTGFWEWNTYKTQNVSEQNAWVQMFMGDIANFSQQNLRDGIGKIFTGSAAANAQRDHCLAIGRRPASRVEKILAIGTGTAASPATMPTEGPITATDVQGLG